MKRLLFVCTGNAARSQMAEGLLRHFAGDRVEVESAGIHPSRVHPLAIEVMKELGIDISHHRSKSVDEFVRDHFDWVITICDSAKQNCPVFPGIGERLHWSLPDPVSGPLIREEDQLQTFRQVRDRLRQHISEFISTRLK
ncbi:MAG: arsenate reductase ArsC [candidate division WOR-3 bacterium]